MIAICKSVIDNIEDDSNENVDNDKSDVDVILENDEDVNECSTTWPSSPLLGRFCRPRFAPNIKLLLPCDADDYFDQEEF